MDETRTVGSALSEDLEVSAPTPSADRAADGLPVWGETIDGGHLLAAAQAGLARLRAVREQVNAMNVFPIPDGDTGTNMLLTMQSACDKARQHRTDAAGEVAAALAQGALVGARGNSGVILSQLWRGFAAGLRGCEAIRAEDFARAWRAASQAAYESVGRPVEGTILTLSADVATAAQAAVSDGVRSVVDLLARVVDEAQRSLERTPDLLPLLRQAGVTDSGAAGLFFILDGMLRAAYGEDLDDLPAEETPGAERHPHAALEIESGQDWEVVVDLRLGERGSPEAIRRSLTPVGTSLQIGQGDGWCRVHLHVRDGCERLVAQALRPLGVLRSIHIETLRTAALSQA